MANKKVQSFIEYLVLRFFLFFFRLIPYPVMAFLLANLLLFGGKILKIRRKLVIRQLRMVFPDWDEKRLNQTADQVYYNLGITAAEVFVGRDRDIFRRCKVEGFDYVTKAREDGEKIMYVSAHFGNWELGAKYIACHTDKVYAVVKKQRNKYFDDYINRKRMESHIQVIPMTNALKYIMTALTNHEQVAFLVDQHANKQGVRMDFLGHETNVYNSVAKMALKTGAVIIPCFDIHCGLLKHRMIVCEPIKTENLTNDEQNVLDITKKIMYTIEVFIKDHPEQWFWVHRRWRD